MAFPRRLGVFAALSLALAQLVVSQEDNLGLGNGYIDIVTPNFNARIVRDAQVLASLRPADDPFDFLPFDLLSVRARNGQYHWGDLTYRYREEGATEWIEGDSSDARQVVDALPVEGDVFAASDLATTLPDSPLSVTREWLQVDEDLGLRFTIENTGDTPLEIGSLGFPAEFNSIFTLRDPTDMQNLCSMSDPYIGLDAGQIRVTPVKGTGRALVVTPLNGTSTPLEAYRNLVEPSFQETAYGSQTFEGFYEWQVLTQAYADNEWGGQEPWNTPSSLVLAPGESSQFGVRFSLAEDVRGLDQAVRDTGTPVAVGVPGYIVPRDLPAQLFLQSDAAVASVSVTPEGALDVQEEGDSRYIIAPSPSAWGRARVTVEYEDGKRQTIHYYITKSNTEVLSDLGQFLTNDAWFNDSSDPFRRSPSVMTYDYEEGAIVEQDSRAWVAGLSDEGGTGAYVAALLKQVLQPNAEEVAKLDEFVQNVIWGQIQTEDYSVRKAIFFYEPSAVPGYTYDGNINWGSWTSWNEEQAHYIDRAYNYVHVAAAYWSLYRVARAYPETVTQEWGWYLDQAQKTVLRVTDNDIWYNDVGLMGETVFGHILTDLEREGRTDQAQAVENLMRERAELWDSQEIPYGSEMAWDSTGQEGVYYWTRHFGFIESERKTVNSVLGYTPNVPHWGWNGNSRRYWDFIYGGKLKRIERQIHHYGSALNAQVLLSAFQDDPSDSYLLRVGYGGSTGPLANINQDGFPSAAFHSWPDTLKWDGITGDYGGGFLGMALTSGTYVADDPDLGVVAYGGLLTTEGGSVVVQPRDAVRKKAFIGPLSVLISIDVGAVEEFSYDLTEGRVSVTVVQQTGSPVAAQAAIWVESTAGEAWVASTAGGIETGRGGWILPLGVEGSTTFQVVRS